MGPTPSFKRALNKFDFSIDFPFSFKCRENLYFLSRGISIFLVLVAEVLGLVVGVALRLTGDVWSGGSFEILLCWEKERRRRRPLRKDELVVLTFDSIEELWVLSSVGG